MQNEFINFYPEVYYKNLEAIEGVKFTPREIDVISCLLSGRTSQKSIASFLSISPKTVDSHIRNIMNKSECPSSENIRDFIETSGKAPCLREHYQNLLIQSSFEKLLKELASLIDKKNLICYILFRSDQEKDFHFLRRIEKYFSLAGVTVRIEGVEKHELLFHLSEDRRFQKADYIFYVVDDILREDLLKIYTTEKIEPPQNLQKNNVFSDKSIFLLIDYQSLKDLPNNLKNIKYVDFKNNYYFSLFEILISIFPNMNFNTFTEEFMVKYDLIQNSSKQKYIQELSDVINNEKEENNVILQMKRLKKRKSLISIIALIMFIFGFYIGFLEVKKHQESQREMHLHSIRSNLMIPTENSFLKRPELIDQIDEKLKGDKGIETIALVGLVGMGGVGKTTLARYYARSKDNSIVWEINAETKSSIIHSFKDLAYTLAKTQNQREELDAIQKIKDTEIKEEQLISFVRDCLREHLNWLLIYDNVEKFSDIKNYFPQDPEAWGHGKVIITTRDSNIKNTNYIKPENVIELGELTKEGALILFGKILYNCDLNKLTQVQKEKMLDFLKEIPPFPLDVSLAAYYMRNENLSYDQYKERMNKFNADFEKSQENLVKETSSYTKTRYAIIISSLQKIIQLNPEYKELLFFICLVDSQAIPKKLLELHKNPVMIDRLLRELRNGSFVSEVMSERTEESIPSFFIHRSTQALSLNFLINSLSLEGRNNFTEKIISTMKNYYEEFSEGDNPKILMFIPHLESLLKNIDKINISKAIHEKCRVDLLLLLGYLHYQSKNFPLAKKYFEDVLEGPNNSSIISVKRLSEIEKDFGYICAELGEADKALIYLQKSIELCKQIPHSEILKAENIKTMGYVYSGKNDFLKSRQYFEEALEIISNIDKNLKKTLLEADIYAQLAILYSMEYLNKNEAYKAEDYALKSLKILKEAQFFYKDSKNDLKKISQRIEKHGWRLGQIYNRLGRYREAIKEFDTNKLSNKTSQNRLLISKGEASLRLGNLETADQSLTEAINMIEKSGKPNTWEPKVLRAEVKIRLGNFEEAYKDCSYILNAKTKKRNNYLNVLFITNFYHLGLIKCKQEKFKESTEYFSMFFEAIEKFCKSFLDEKIYNDLELKGVFQRVTYHESTVIQDIQGSLQRSTKIFSAIYGASHPFVCDYVLKNGEDFKKNPPLSLWKGLKNMFYIFFKNGSLCL